jgi:hypothetical protein
MEDPPGGDSTDSHVPGRPGVVLVGAEERLRARAASPYPPAVPAEHSGDSRTIIRLPLREKIL